MKLKLMMAGVFMLSACTTAPVVSEFNGSSVKLQTSAFGNVKEARAATQAEANRICGKVGKRAEYASTRSLPDYTVEHLYLCL